MAVHTPLSLPAAQTLGACWGLDVLAVAGIAAGTLNSSYMLTTGAGRVFLRICEQVGPAAAEAEARLLAQLAAAGVPTPAPLARTDVPHTFVAAHAGKPALALRWVDGAPVCARSVSPSRARQVGAALATIHRVDPGPSHVPEDMYTLDRLDARLAAAAVPRERPDLRDGVDRLRARLATLGAAAPLPVRGVIHGDLFRENTLWHGPTLVAVVDFEAACAGNFCLDLMIAALAWCFTDRFEPARVRALVAGYRSVRDLERDELPELHPAALAAAVRFAVTRLVDYELRPERGEYRDYRRFLARLEHLDALGPARWRELLGS